MGRPLRRHQPGQYSLITIRCHQARFFLRPDTELNGAVLEWLTRTQSQFPDVRIFAVCVMSNHLHLLVRDDRGELAAWACYFFGNLARAVDRIRGRHGVVFERRHSAEPVLDDEALLDRLVYTVTNPVAAGLCKRAGDWPGIVLYAVNYPREILVTWVDREKSRFARMRAKTRRDSVRKGAECVVHGRLMIDPLPAADDETGEVDRIEIAIEARERQLAEDRLASGRRTRTRGQVLAQSWHSAPSQPSRSPRPVCHTSDAGLRKQFISGLRDFVGLFREASKCLREGGHNAAFPLWCYPPGLTLVRTVSISTAGAG